MKANQFLRNNDDAVSPVIAVILMVAITVVLAATVYVWVSGFGSNTGGAPAHTMSMTSAGPISNANAAGDADAADANEIHRKTYTVSSADPSLTYGDMKLTLGGIEHAFDATGCTVESTSTLTAGWGACAGTASRALTASVSAGDTITIACWGESSVDENLATNCLTDKDLLILDTEANSVMITLKLR